MNQELATRPEGRQISPQQMVREDLHKMADQFALALPEHIKPERFQRIVLTAVLGDPQLLRADRKSLLESAMRAAQDGLLPDKREGAFVTFRTKVNGEFVSLVQWMPMIGGIIKKMHQSGDVALITAKVVYGGDNYRTWVDDDGEHVIYEPSEHPDYDTIRQVFAMAKMKDGTVYVEPVTPRDIDKIRSISRSGDKGPWATWWEEMAKKSAIRRLAKRLNLSPDIHDLIQRDNALYDLSLAPEPRPTVMQRLASARPATQDSPDEQEGFDLDHVSRETETRVSDNTQSDDTAPNPSSDEGDDSPSQPQSSPSTNSEAGSSHVEASDESGGDTPASSLSPIQECAVKILGMSIDPLFEAPQQRRGALEASKNEWKASLPEDDWSALKSLVSSADAIIKGDASYSAAVEFFAEQLEMNPDRFPKEDE